jgi:peptide/nickel transport system substrate-binding protein
MRYPVPAEPSKNTHAGGTMSLRRIVVAPVLAIAAFAAIVTTLTARAADLTIGLGADVTAIDPHYHNVTPNNNVAAHIFAYLVQRNEKSKREPGLATQWKTVDPLTIRLRTATPCPLMPSDMTQVAIISKAAARATTEDFNSGKAAIGTGPYKLVRYAKGDRIELARNDAWWGGKTPWTKVTMRILPQDAARVAALLSGDVQVIENVPTTDVARLRNDKRLSVYRTVADRLIYLHLDSHRDVSPFVTDNSGKPLERNPLRDTRVRKAMSKAINRPAIVAKVMEGEAVPSGQLVADFLFGATKNLKVEPYDPEGAKKLLAEAGWPDGFGLTIHAPNNRYVNDAKIAQAVAQMLTRIGIDTKVVAMPSATYFTQASELKFSFMLVGWSTGTGEASSSLKALLMTYNRERGFGTANRGRYSNPKVDALTEDALATVDDAKREALLQRATELAINDTGIIPLHFQVNLWATRDAITYVPRTDEYTMAWKFRPT